MYKYVNTRKKIFLQKASPSGIEHTRDLIKNINTNNEIEKEFINDMLIQISGQAEKEYRETVEESGIFYFFYAQGEEINYAKGE